MPRSRSRAVGPGRSSTTSLDRVSPAALTLALALRTGRAPARGGATEALAAEGPGRRGPGRRVRGRTSPQGAGGQVDVDGNRGHADRDLTHLMTRRGDRPAG